MTWMEELAFNEKVLNGFDLPEPEDGQDLRAYKKLAELSVSVHVLPPEMKGCLFNFMAEDEIAAYLQKRFGVRVRPETRYIIRRVL